MLQYLPKPRTVANTLGFSKSRAALCETGLDGGCSDFI